MLYPKRSTYARSTYACTIKRLRRSGIGVLTRTAPDRENSREGANWPTCTGINITQLAQAGKPSLGKLMRVFFNVETRRKGPKVANLRQPRTAPSLCHYGGETRLESPAPCQKHALRTLRNPKHPALWVSRRNPVTSRRTTSVLQLRRLLPVPS